MTAATFDPSDHVMIPVNADGDGPERNPNNVAAVVCLCGVPQCEEFPQPGMAAETVSTTSSAMVG
jgi:hypothetical protein